MKYFIFNLVGALLGLLSLSGALGTDSVVAGNTLGLAKGSVGIEINKLGSQLGSLLDLERGNSREV